MTQRTYWHLAALGKKPGDYDIATTRLLYYVERGFELELPLSAWYRRYQAGSPLTCADWDRFRDPRETTYSKYVELQRTREAFVDGVIAAGDAARLAPAWRAELAALASPLRFPVHGLQMIAAYVGHMAPGGRIAVAAALQAADEARRIERLAYRLRELERLGDAVDGRLAWEREPRWQPLRELIERVLVTYDWGEAVVALAAVVKPRFDALVGGELAARARAAGDDVLGNTLFSLAEDARWHAAWTAALIGLVAAEHRAVIDGWIARWTPLATRAVAALAPAFGPGASAAAEAASAAWAASAGLAP